MYKTIIIRYSQVLYSGNCGVCKITVNQYTKEGLYRKLKVRRYIWKGKIIPKFTTLEFYTIRILRK